jgi:nucleoid DNA-binding protein
VRTKELCCRAARRLAEEHNASFTAAEVHDVFESVLAVLKEALRDGHQVIFPGVGRFEPVPTKVLPADPPSREELLEGMRRTTYRRVDFAMFPALKRFLDDADD